LGPNVEYSVSDINCAECDLNTGIVTVDLDYAVNNNIDSIVCKAKYANKTYEKTLKLIQSEVVYKIDVDKTILFRDPETGSMVTTQLIAKVFE
jgi:topoisomerase IA-like protein